MSEQTTAMAVAALRAAYPRQDFPDESVRMYVRKLSDLDPVMVEAAVDRLTGRSAWLPAISEIRLEVAEEKCPLPTPAEAWTLATTPPGERSELPREVRDAIAAMGGSYTITHSERPETLRAQFLKDYQQRRDTAMLEAVGARAPRPQLTRAEQAFGVLAGTSISDLPPVDESVIRPRPVWARWLRRQELQSLTSNAAVVLAAPSPQEKHDAILVLAECAEEGHVDGGIHDVGGALHEEAQRIMDEASAA